MLLAACQPGLAKDERASEQTRSGSPDTGQQEWDPFGATHLVDVEAEAKSPREGAQYKVRFRGIHGASNRNNYVALALDDSGSLITARSDLADDGELLGKHLQLGRVGGEGWTPLTYPGGMRLDQAVHAAAAGRTIAWIQTPSTDPFRFDWSAYAWTEGTHDRVLLGSSNYPPNAQVPEVYGSTSPTVASHGIYWAASIPGANGRAPTGAIYGADPLTGRPLPGTPIAKAGLPVAVDDTLYFVRNPELSGRDGLTQIIRRDRSGDHVVISVRLTGQQRVTKLAATRTHLAWVVSRGPGSADEIAASDLYLRDLRTRAATRFSLKHAGAPTMFLSLTPHLMAWGSGSSDGDGGEYAYDLSRKSLWRLHNEPGYSLALAQGRTVAWAALPSDKGGPAVYTVADWR